MVDSLKGFAAIFSCLPYAWGTVVSEHSHRGQGDVMQAPALGFP
jgi:hypothetical protein